MCGLPLSFYTVESPYLGRKYTMAAGALMTGVFICLFTVSEDTKFQLAFSSLEAMSQNITYGVLYVSSICPAATLGLTTALRYLYTPEVFPAQSRGTGCGIASFLNRVFGLCAPVLAANVNQGSAAVSIYVSGGLFVAAGAAALCLPIETRSQRIDQVRRCSSQDRALSVERWWPWAGMAVRKA